MSLPVSKSPLAKDDLIELADYIARDNEAAAERFPRAVDETLELLARFPDIGSPYETANPRNLDLRFQGVKGFPNHFIFYRVRRETLIVIRILHGRRDLHGLFG